MRAKTFAGGLVVALALGLVPVSLSAQTAHPQIRQGFWFSGGLGYGSLGGKGWGSREGGFSGELSAGGTLSQKVLLGAATTAWTRSENGVTVTAGTVTGLVRFYPSAQGGLFVTGGLGFGNLHTTVAGFGTDKQNGASVLIGVGYDFRVGSMVSLTPYYNVAAITYDHTNVNYAQLGLAVTLH